MQFTKREVVSGSGSGAFLKLKDGESKTVVCRGEIYEFQTKWENGKAQLCGPDEGSPRFRLNAIVHEDGKFVSRIWEFPTYIYNLLGGIHEEMDLETTKLKITRKGTGTNTEYMIIPIGTVPANHLQQIEAVDLQPLEHRRINHLDNQKPEDVPF